jgi:hypothetical protein
MVTKHIQITEDERRQRAYALPKAAGDGDIHEQPLPRSANKRVHGSLLPRPTIIHAASLESMAPDGVAPRWRKRHH